MALVTDARNNLTRRQLLAPFIVSGQNIKIVPFLDPINQVHEPPDHVRMGLIDAEQHGENIVDPA